MPDRAIFADQIQVLNSAGQPISPKPVVRTPSKPSPAYNPSPYRAHTTAATATERPVFNPYLRYSFATKPSAQQASAKSTSRMSVTDRKTADPTLGDVASHFARRQSLQAALIEEISRDYAEGKLSFSSRMIQPDCSA